MQIAIHLCRLEHVLAAPVLISVPSHEGDTLISVQVQAHALLHLLTLRVVIFLHDNLALPRLTLQILLRV